MDRRCFMNKKLLIIGANGHGKVVADIAQRTNKYEDIVFIDDNENIKECVGKAVVGSTKELEQYVDEYDMFVAIGNTSIRNMILDKLIQINASVPILIHPNAIVGMNVEIGMGTVVMAGAIINPAVKIGVGCIINTGATVDHDCVIGDYVHISVGSHLAGTVIIGNNSWIGIGAIVSNNISVGPNIVVGAGGVVIKNIEVPGTYVGIPVKNIK